MSNMNTETVIYRVSDELIGGCETYKGTDEMVAVRNALQLAELTGNKTRSAYWQSFRFAPPCGTLCITRVYQLEGDSVEIVASHAFVISGNASNIK